jgi:hypothetical protein
MRILLHVCVCRCNESDDSRSDGEEEFYYTEIEVNVDNVTQKFSQMCTSSPPEITSPLSPAIPVPDHDYQKKVRIMITHCRKIPWHISMFANDLTDINVFSGPWLKITSIISAI